MKKLLILFLTILISVALAGIFGIVHDQITYTICPEYYTKFKFAQFSLNDIGNVAIMPNPRLRVAVVGFLATWWVGKYIGIVLGIIGLIFLDHKKMFKAILNALLLTFCVTCITAFIGFLYGKFHLTKTGVNWWLPDNLIDKNSFITVGSIHNFSYLGGAIGLLIAVIYLMLKNRSQRKELLAISS